MNDSKRAELIEYLDYFSEPGEFLVTVSFDQKSAKISNLSASQTAFENLKKILAAQKSPIMAFDEHLGEVKKILLDPVKKTIHINVGLLRGKH